MVAAKVSSNFLDTSLALWWHAISTLTPLFFLIFLSLCPAHAADSYMSRSETIDPDTYIVLETTHEPTGPVVASDSSRTIFDVVVSLYNSPDGDNNPDNDTVDEAQAKYESIIRHWADGVCEQSNGVHRLGVVRIFVNGVNHAIADVVWNEREHPRAYVSGFGVDNLPIIMGDIFPSGAGVGSDYDMLADPEGAGYTLAHEWGHYVYGLYDEYRGSCALDCRDQSPQDTDMPTDKSIMSNTWRARDRNYEWLNHSTENNISAATAQWRVYGKSGWEVLVQSTNHDPKLRPSWPKRVRYANLVSEQPSSSDNWFSLQLSDTTEQSACRDDLEIIWATGDVEMVLVLDVSGSMAGNRLAQTKIAATTLVDIVPSGTTLGVLSFSSETYRIHPLTEISDSTEVRTTIKNKINALTAAGDTVFYDAAYLGARELETYGQAGSNKLVFALTDGDDTASVTLPDQVVSKFHRVDAALNIFGFGPSVPEATLRDMATRTGGRYYPSPTTLRDIQAVFIEANSKFTDSSILKKDSASVVPTSRYSSTVTLDDTLSEVTIVVTFSAAIEGASLTVTDQTGSSIASYDSFDCEQTASETLCSFKIAGSDRDDLFTTADTSDVTIEIENKTSTDLPAQITVTGNPEEGIQQIVVSLNEVTGSQGVVQYPSPMVITAVVRQGLPITDVSVIGEITDPSGNHQSITFRDDGMEGDAQAQDGIYTSIHTYDADGLYTAQVTVSNPDGTARYTVDGFQPSHAFAPAEDGTQAESEPLPTFDRNFQRTATLQVNVAGFRPDDHENAPTNCSELDNLNGDVIGRIDAANDVDCFGFTPALQIGEVVRVSGVGANLDPILALVAADGTQVRSLTDANAKTVGGYWATTITDDDLMNIPLYLLVSNSNDVIRDTFQVSRGELLPGDMLDNSEPNCLDLENTPADIREFLLFIYFYLSLVFGVEETYFPVTCLGNIQ